MNIKFMQLGYKTLGNGRETVFVIHDWFSDCQSFDSLQPYLNTGFYKFVFVDLRGYGRSKAIYGSCTVEEASQDIVSIANSLKIDQFNLVGHSMGGQIVQYLPIYAPNRVKSIVAICPVPACGVPIPDDAMQHLEKVAKGDMLNAKAILQYMTQNRYHDWFYERKALNWFACSSPQARVAYLKMFCETDFSNLITGIDIPMLVVCGDFDAEAYGAQRSQETICKYFKKSQLVCLPSGHYPMEETPILLASVMEKFWNQRLIV
jgi:pimeloyl-ACP methyl ester carboxylesterase